MRRSPLFPGVSPPFIFAHRGCSKLAPENTMPAFALCIELGVPGIEIDVQVCKSGELVVIHDFDLDRLAGISAVIKELSYRELSAIDVGSRFSPKYKGTGVPLLTQVLDRFGKDLYFDLEIKTAGTENEGIANKILSLIAEKKLKDRCLISSFNPYVLRSIKDIDPNQPTALIYSKIRDLYFFLRHGEGRFAAHCDALKPGWEQVSELSIWWNKKLWGYPIIPWTVDDPKVASRLLKLNVDGLISNQPYLLIS